MNHTSFRGNESWKDQACQRLGTPNTSDSKSAAARRASSSLAAGTIGSGDVSDHSRLQNFRTVSATATSSAQHAAVRKVLKHHGLTLVGDAVVEADLIAAVLSETPADHPREFSEGQWWLAELDAMVASGTPDQKRAVAVVRHLMRSAHKHADGRDELRRLQEFAAGVGTYVRASDDHWLDATPEAAAEIASRAIGIRVELVPAKP